MKDKLLKFLFETSQAVDDLDGVAEDIQDAIFEEDGEEMTVNKTPLAHALKTLGIPAGNLELDPRGLSLTFTDGDEYKAAVNILEQPDSWARLAELGWVASLCGSFTMTGEPDQWRIRFLEINVAETSDKDSAESVKEIMRKGREFATQKPETYKDNPVEHPEPTNVKRKGLGTEKDGAQPGSGGTHESLAEGAHKPGCECGFCKNKGRGFGKKKDADKTEAEKGAEEAGLPAPDDEGAVSHTFESEEDLDPETGRSVQNEDALDNLPATDPGGALGDPYAAEAIRQLKEAGLDARVNDDGNIVASNPQTEHWLIVNTDPPDTMESFVRELVENFEETWQDVIGQHIEDDNTNPEDAQ